MGTISIVTHEPLQSFFNLQSGHKKLLKKQCIFWEINYLTLITILEVWVHFRNFQVPLPLPQIGIELGF